MRYAIQAEGLVKRYGETRRWTAWISSCPRAALLGVLGPNGAGKTTAVRILATLLRPDAGRASVGGFDVCAQAHQVRSLIGLTGQYAAVDEMLTGVENLVMIGRLLGIVQRREARGRPSCWSGSTSPTPAAGRPRPTPAACAAGSTWPPAWWAGRRCCSWTSRPPGSTRAAAPSCGASCAAWWPTA